MEEFAFILILIAVTIGFWIGIITSNTVNRNPVFKDVKEISIDTLETKINKTDTTYTFQININS